MPVARPANPATTRTTARTSVRCAGWAAAAEADKAWTTGMRATVRRPPRRRGGREHGEHHARRDQPPGQVAGIDPVPDGLLHVPGEHDQLPSPSRAHHGGHRQRRRRCHHPGRTCFSVAPIAASIPTGAAAAGPPRTRRGDQANEQQDHRRHAQGHHGCRGRRVLATIPDRHTAGDPADEGVDLLLVRVDEQRRIRSACSIRDGDECEAVAEIGGVLHGPRRSTGRRPARRCHRSSRRGVGHVLGDR